jgi:glucosamine--fructose-6-phosphate aminotransferase (isomerizing)
MCGIFGGIATADVVPSLIGGLRALAYRGYDSAGIATLESSRLAWRHAAGKLENLERVVESYPLDGTIGIGHTRWATHGAATIGNAHPHRAGRVAVVHNGIIENHAELRRQLSERGRVFTSQTDTEVIPHLIDEQLSLGLAPLDAVAEAVKSLKGSYAIAAIFEEEDDLMVVARQRSPLLAAVTPAGAYVASDAIALSPFAREAVYLNDGDIAALSRSGIAVIDETGKPVERAYAKLPYQVSDGGKQGYRHYMLKEIHEQPKVMLDTLSAYETEEPAVDFATVRHLDFIGCGTSHYAGLTAQSWFERLAQLPTSAGVASERRHRILPPEPGTLTCLMSQSGETADTLGCLEELKRNRAESLAIVNVAGSSLARGADYVAQTLAGPEIGVASTKAFTAQLTTLARLAITAGEQRGCIGRDAEQWLTAELMQTAIAVQQVLDGLPSLDAAAASIVRARSVLFLGRGQMHPIALEGALKLKETSYIHAEGFAAGELKHGPIALIEQGTPVVVLAPPGELFEKTASNLREVTARGAHVILLSTEMGIAELKDDVAHAIALPEIDPLWAPILYTVPLQMLAYAVALKRGADIDQPRNLAKSVTVE